MTESLKVFSPYHLTVNNDTHPLNVEGTPKFGWWSQSEDTNVKQSAYQIQVQTSEGEVVWDSEKMTGAQQLNVKYAGAALKNEVAYQWRVRVWNQDETASDWSDWAIFEMGLDNSSWEGAKWLKRDLTDGEIKGDQWTIGRREVTLKSTPIKRVRSYAAANHDYELYVEGNRADRGPSYAYVGEGYYQAADITDLVRGKQKVTLGLLAHWYGNGQGRPAGVPGFLLKVVFEYEDGSHQVAVTDENWKVARGPYDPEDLRNGEGDHIEHFDAVREAANAGWTKVGFDDTNWQSPVVIGPHPTAPFTKVTGQETRMSETPIKPARILIAADGTQVIDLGKVYPVRIHVHFKNGRQGKVVHLLAGYELTETGRVATDHVTSQGTDMSYYYTEKDGEQTFKAFTHLAFRYLEIPDVDEDFSLADIGGVIVHREVPDDMYAKFATSDKTLNQVWELMQRSALMGVQQQFVDTPTREKGQFLVDAANVSYATMSVLGERSGSRQALNEFLESQDRYWNEGKDAGRYNSVYPNGDGKRDIPDYTELYPDWAWQYYRYSGDKDFLKKAYPYLYATAQYILRNIATDGPAEGLVYRLDGGSGPYLNGIIDWPAHSRFGFDMETTARTPINVLGVNVLETVAKIGAEIGGVDQQVKELTSAYQHLSETINDKLRKDDGLYADGMYDDGTLSRHTGQISNSYVLAFDIAPKSSRPKIAEWLGKQGMKQGPMTVHWLLKALAENGEGAALLKLLTNKDDYGWAQQVAIGRTYTPEAWHLSGDANSESHAWSAQAIVDLITGVLGLSFDEAGTGHAVIKVPNIPLNYAGGTIYSNYGPITVAWQKDKAGQLISLTVKVPANSGVKLIFPAGLELVHDRQDAPVTSTGEGKQIELGSGNWQFKKVAQKV